MNKNQKGFGLIEALLIFVIVAVLGFVSWYVYKSKQNTTNTYNSAATNSTANAKVGSYSGWKTYCDATAKSCFSYPSEWRLTDSSQPQNNFVAVSLQNPKNSLEVDYRNPVDPNDVDDRTPPSAFQTVDIHSTYTLNSNLKVVGGYYASNHDVRYTLLDSSNVQKYELSPGKLSENVPSPGLLDYTSKTGPSIGRFMGVSGHLPPELTTSEANAWFKSDDAKMVLKIIQSFYYK